MTPSEIKSILRDLGGYANKRLGQHFLIDCRVLETIVETADLHAGDRVLEIGPGLGVLTQELLAHDADVIAIERDRRFVEYLKIEKTPLLRQEGVGGVMKIVQGDAAVMDWHDLIGNDPWKLISNLPYSITSLALRKALWSPNPATNVVVLVQREVAERAISVAPKQKTSLLSLMIALASSSARIIRRVPAGAFFPPPKVESAILQIIPMSLADRKARWGIDPEKIMAIAKQGFAHPRKLLISNLKSVIPAKAGIQWSAELCFRKVGISLKARAEDLSPDDWAALSRSLDESS